ncbi:hypothetical protein H0H81_011990 [Sphagnurus paluster]|uniref:Uncharacterized protein n=1 Tax=Sphagnurus paluster TaxID=117069 RepID=A0A9P7GP39_9AGAR|nr:hypothetical protein H0H81_011990 [Sphagnurus paluster]
MVTHLDTEFLRRISLIESELLKLNPSTVDSFHPRWTTLVDDLKLAIESESLSDSTITIAYTLASRVSKMFQTFLDLEALAEKLMTSLLDDDNTTTSDTPSLVSEVSDVAVPKYIKPSYDWLLDNLHDPYPSTRVRDAIAHKSGTARRDVDNWFIDARKRIGWNALRKASFNNKRVEIVDAATRFFIQDDPKRPIDPTIEYEFISMKKRAQDLYVDKFTESVLVAKLDVAVKNLTPRTKAEAKAEEQRLRQLQKDRNSYPSPERSPEQSPEPTRLSPVPDQEDEDNKAPESISMTSRKRRYPSVDPQSSGDVLGDITTKRARCVENCFVSACIDFPSSRLDTSSHSDITIPTGLPSPASSVVDEASQSFETSCPASASAPLTVATSASRKRRLSESNGQGAPKRPCNLPVGPRMQAVSDPLPLSSALFDASAFDGWFQQNFDLQNIPNVGEISPSGFDIELGNLSDFDCESPTQSGRASLDISSLVNESHSDVQLPEFTIQDLESFLVDDSLSANFALHDTSLAPEFCIQSIPSIGMNFLNNFEKSFQVPVEPHVVANPDISTSITPDFNYQWEFSDYLNIGTQEPTSLGKLLDIPQNSLGIVPSTMGDFMLPPVVDYFAPSQAEVRAEKEAKLKKMKEETLRLEMELATSQ